MQSLNDDIHLLNEILNWLFTTENHPIKAGIIYSCGRDEILLLVHVQPGSVEIVIQKNIDT